MIERTLLVALVVLVAFAAVALWQRRGTTRLLSLPVGLTIVAEDTCRDCDTAKAEFDRLGVSYTAISVADAVAAGLTTRSIPTAVVSGPGGEALLVRRGRSVITDSGAIAAAISDQ